MNPEVLLASHNVPLSPYIDFMNPDKFDELRKEQYEYQNENSTTAEEDVNEHLDKMAQAFVSENFPRDNMPDMHDKLVALARKNSVHNMDSTQWYLGEPDEDGDHVRPETVGYLQLEKELADLWAMPDPAPGEDTPPNDDPDQTEVMPLTAAFNQAELDESREGLSAARDDLARLRVTLRRRLHNGGKERKQDKQDFEAALERYQTALTRYGVANLAKARSQNASDDELRAQSITTAIEEHSALTNCEWKILNEDDSRRAKIARWLAKSNRRFFGITLGTGVVLGVAGRAAGSAVLGVGLGALGGVGLAVGTTKAALTSLVGVRKLQYTEHFKRAEQDAEAIKAGLQDGDLDKHGNIIADIIGKRVDKDVNYNRRRVATAALIGATGGALGAFAPEIANGAAHVAHNFHLPHFGSDHLATKPVTPTTHSPSPVHHGTGNHLNRNHTDGFNDNVVVEHGHGYTTELQELAAQKNIHLSGAQSFELYKHLTHQFGGHLFTNDASYHMAGGNYGISHAGNAHWNPAVVHEMNNWLKTNKIR